MANSTNSLSHTKWLCKYHIVIVPKYRRKIIYNQYRKDLQKIIRTLCKYKGVEIIEGHMMPDHVIGSKEDLGDAGFEYNYEVHKFGTDETKSAEYWNWTCGGKTVYMPTFNKNKDSLVADINGTFENDYTDYVEYEKEESKEATAIYDSDSNNIDEVGKDFDNLDDYVTAGNIKTITEDHTAKETETAKFISMSEWLQLAENGEDTDNYWVYDEDGWVYWSSPIKAGTATGLLLDEISLTEVMDDSYYYAINVEGQFITADDLGKDDSTGFYDPNDTAPTVNALTLLKKIGVKVDNDTADDEETIDYQTLALNSIGDSVIAFSEDLETNKPIKLVDEEGTALSEDDVNVMTLNNEGSGFDNLTNGVDYTFENGYLKILSTNNVRMCIYIADEEFEKVAHIVFPTNPDSDSVILKLQDSEVEVFYVKINQPITVYLKEKDNYINQIFYDFRVIEENISGITDLESSQFTFENNQLTITDSSYVGKLLEVYCEEISTGDDVSAFFYILPEDN